MGLNLLAEQTKLSQTGLGPGTGDVLVVAIKRQGIGWEVEATGSGGVGAEVVLTKGNGERGVGGEIEFGVTLAPIPANCSGQLGAQRRCGKPGMTDLMTAMLTGAKVLARYTSAAAMMISRSKEWYGLCCRCEAVRSLMVFLRNIDPWHHF